MNTWKPNWRLIVTGFGSCALLVACEPQTPTPVGPNPLVEESPASAIEPDRPRTLRDEWSDIAMRVPGGFGGVFFDADGELTLVLADPGALDAAVLALENEPFFVARTMGKRFDLRGARVQVATYRYDDLFQWYRALVAEMTVPVPRISIGVAENRILVGVSNASHAAEVHRAREAAGVPDAAVVLRTVPRMVPIHLQGTHRPVPAGVRVWFNPGSGPPCTLGPNVLRLTTPAQEGFLIPSHCTNTWGSVHPTLYFQPTQSPQNYFGNEALDRPVISCTSNVSYGCRYSDNALGLYAGGGYPGPERGFIARPDSRNQGSLSIDVNNPRFQITAAMPWSIDGEILEKVGQTTGWTGGVVTDGCADITPTDSQGFPTGPTIWCSVVFQAGAAGGDSGAPIFRIISENQVELRGTAHSAGGGLIAGSNLGGIETDLDAVDPWWGAALQYW